MSLFKALQFIKSKGEGTIPGVAARFKVSQSTSDNWLRRGVDRGFLKRYTPKTGEYDQVKGTVGRPASTYTLTAKGAKALAAGELPGGDRSGWRAPPKSKAKGKAKRKAGPKAKAKVAKKAPAKAKRKAAPKVAEKAPKAKAARKAMTQEQKDAKNKALRDKRAKAKEAKAAPPPAQEVPQAAE